MNIERSATKRSTAKGVIYALAAFIWWSPALFYYKTLAHANVKVTEIISHRVIWSFVLAIIFLSATRRIKVLLNTLTDRRQLVILGQTTVFIGFSWSLFTWAVTNDRIIETSLGYYINPLVNVILGCIFLNEKLSRHQAVSILLAAIGVVIMGISYGRIPVISLLLACSFGMYGMLRKKISLDGAVGVGVETLLLAPVALAYLMYLGHTHQLVIGGPDQVTNLLLLSAGIVTVFPLIWFVNAARRLRYTSIGLLMFSKPTITFLLAVFVFKEPFDSLHLFGFCCVWAALIIYLFSSFRQAGHSLKENNQEIYIQSNYKSHRRTSVKLTQKSTGREVHSIAGNN